MKRIILLALLFCVSIVLLACGSSETGSNSQANGNRASNIEPQTYINNNGQGTPANAEVLANANVDTGANKFANRLEEMRAAAANTQSKKPVPVNTRPAPEDSEITTTLTDVAREVRVWKTHPTLAKVEKVYDGQNVSIKVYLRNGKVVDLPGTAIAQLDQIPSATVLTLVGVGPTAQKPSAPSKTENPAKKNSN